MRAPVAHEAATWSAAAVRTATMRPSWWRTMPVWALGKASAVPDRGCAVELAQRERRAPKLAVAEAPHRSPEPDGDRPVVNLGGDDPCRPCASAKLAGPTTKPAGESVKRTNDAEADLMGGCARWRPPYGEIPLPGLPAGIPDAAPRQMVQPTE